MRTEPVVDGRPKGRKGASVIVTEEAWSWLEGALAWAPGRIGRLVRSRVYEQLLHAGGGLDVAEQTHIRSPSGLRVGRRVSLGRGVQLTCGGGLTVGDDVMFGQGAFVITNGHVMDRTDIPMVEQGLYAKPVVIESDVWVGSKAVILPGVRVGRGAVVAAGSVVTKDVPAYSVVGGVPARVLRTRSSTAGPAATTPGTPASQGPETSRPPAHHEHPG